MTTATAASRRNVPYGACVASGVGAFVDTPVRDDAWSSALREQFGLIDDVAVPG